MAPSTGRVFRLCLSHIWTFLSVPAGDVNSCQDEYIASSSNKEHWRHWSCVCKRKYILIPLYKGSHPDFLMPPLILKCLTTTHCSCQFEVCNPKACSRRARCQLSFYTRIWQEGEFLLSMQPKDEFTVRQIWEIHFITYQELPAFSFCSPDLLVLVPVFAQ